MTRQRAIDLGRLAAQAVRQGTLGAAVSGTPFAAAGDVERLQAAAKGTVPSATVQVGEGGALFFRIGESRIDGPDIIGP